MALASHKLKMKRRWFWKIKIKQTVSKGQPNSMKGEIKVLEKSDGNSGMLLTIPTVVMLCKTTDNTNTIKQITYLKYLDSFLLHHPKK